jgi:hypothetical protein
MTPKDKELVRLFADAIETVTCDLVAYQVAIEKFRESYPDHATLLEVEVLTAQDSDEIKETVHLRYKAALEKFFEQVPAFLPLSEVQALFQSLIQRRKPSRN